MPDPANYHKRRYAVWSISNSALQLILLVITAAAGGSQLTLWAVLAAAALGTFTLLYWVRPRNDERRQPLKRADKLTLVRFGLTGIIGLLIALAPAHQLPAAGCAALAVGIISVILDGIDGKLARKDGPTEFGSILDIEGDTYFMVVAIVAAVTRLQAPMWAPLLVSCRFIYVFIRFIPSRSRSLPRWFRRPMQINGVFGTAAVGIWYLDSIPRTAAAALLLAATSANIASFLLTCYLQYSGGATGKSS